MKESEARENWRMRPPRSRHRRSPRRSADKGTAMGEWEQDGGGRDKETGCESEGKGGGAEDGGEEERSERGQGTPEEEGGVA